MSDCAIEPQDGPVLQQGFVGTLRWFRASCDQDGARELEEALVVVFSHDCDIPHPEEEYLEFGLVSRVEDCDGNLTYAKNPRRLHLENDDSGDGFSIAVEMRSKFDVRRENLVSFVLEWPLSLQSVHVLQRWLANRYSRAAFPDSFNNRRSPARTVVRKILSKGTGGRHLSGVYVAVSDEELPEDQDYEMVIIGAMPVESFEDPVLRMEAEATIADITGQLDRLKGLAVEDFFVLSEGEFTIDQFLRLKRLDFDDLSLRPAPVGPPPASL